MTPAPTPDARAQRIHDKFAARAAKLGLRAIFCAPDGTPFDANDAGLSIVLCAAASGVDVISKFAGGHLLRLETLQGRRRVALHLVIVPAGSAHESSLAQIHALLVATHADLTELDKSATTISQFSDRLAQSYEEVQLLFRMGRLLNNVPEPEQALRGMLEQLRDVEPFGWLAVRFAEAAGCVGSLRGKLLVAGELTRDRAAFDTAAGAMVQRVTTDDWSRIVKPGRLGDATQCVATLTGNEVLAEPIMHDGKPIALLLAGDKFGEGQEKELSSFETQFLDAAADFFGFFHENMSRFDEQQRTFLGTLNSLTAAIDAKDHYTRGHSQRVALLASMLATALGLESATVEQYRIAGLVHDVGKIGVPEAVLTKPARLTDDEFAQIKMHPEIGHTILKDIPALVQALPGVLYHHEQFNGRGYPHGLVGDAIPHVARVLALADTFDAMSSNRAYRTARTRDTVLGEITRCAGTQFDPGMAAAFVKMDFTPFDVLLVTHSKDGAADQVKANQPAQAA